MTRLEDLSALIKEEVSNAARNAPARAWANDYVFPPEMLISDAMRLAYLGLQDDSSV
jgi:hypothetical protein